MRSITLSNAEVLQLIDELNGRKNPSTGEEISKGLLSEPLPIKVRYWLGRINSKLESRNTIIDKLRSDLIQVLGEKEGDSVQIKMTIEEVDKKTNEITKVINPKYKEFIEEFGKVLSEKEEIDVPEFTIEDLGELNTTIPLNVFFKLIQDSKD
jgi:hypothetical protein